MKGLEERADCLRREDRGRLVKNEQLRLRHERAQNLNALTLAHGELHHDRSRIDLKTVLFAELADLFCNLGGRELPGKAERHILRNGERIEERKVLVHHCNAELAGFGRTFYCEGLAVKGNLTLVGAGCAVDDLHHRGFARAVLAQDGEDFSGGNLERDAVVGDDARIALRNVAKAQSWCHADVFRRFRRPDLVELNRGIGRELPGKAALWKPEIISPASRRLLFLPENADLFEAIYCNCSCMENGVRQTNASTVNPLLKTSVSRLQAASRISGILKKSPCTESMRTAEFFFSVRQ